MQQIKYITILLMFTISLAACSKEKPKTESKEKPADTTTEKGPDANSDIPACKPGHFGPDCKPCTCKHGTCYDGKEGNGKCISCEEGWDGENCDSCDRGYFGENCTICACQYGLCDDGKEGSGRCLECDEDYYGENCQNFCQCDDDQPCDYGIDGIGCLCVGNFCGDNCNTPIKCQLEHGELDPTNGHCKSGSCKDNYSGLDCAEPPCTMSDQKCNSDNRNGVKCEGGHLQDFLCDPTDTCDQASDGSLSCKPVISECEEGHFGENCDPCTCGEHGICNDGKSGNGKCSSCDTNYFGENCLGLSTCKYGITNEGPTGDGHCKSGSCKGNFAGEDCDTCAEGFSGQNCDECAEGYFGATCQKCECNTLQECDDGQNGVGCQCKNPLMSGANCETCDTTKAYGPNCTP